MEFLNNPLFPLILMFVVMYFLILRPKQTEMKKLEEQIRGLKKGDRILTSGGIYANISEIKEDSFLVLVDASTKMEIVKSAVAKVIPKEEK